MHPGLATIDRQIEAMTAEWPHFDVVCRDARTAVWEGMLRPAARAYRVRVGYTVPLAIERFEVIKIQPRVQVLSPTLEAHEDYEEGPIPHVYLNRTEPDLPFLCLFDPYAPEWTPADLIAATTLRWTARYLFFYEGWLATKRWHGGGRHPTPEERCGRVDAGKAIETV